MRGRILRLYEQKERIASKLFDKLTAYDSDLFTAFGYWFESVTFDKQKPELSDIIYFEDKFRDLEESLIW